MLNKIIATLFTRGFVAIINLCILLISAKQLGGDVRGQISLFLLNIAVIQTINEIFTGYSLVHFIPKISPIKLYKFGVLWTVLIIAIVCVCLWLFEIVSKEHLIHTCILSFLIIQNSFQCVIILGKEKIKLYNFLILFQPLLLLLSLFVCVFILNYKELNSYILSLYVSFTFSLLISLFFVFKVFVKEATQEERKFMVSEIFKNGFYNQLANLSHMLSNRFNFYLLSSSLVVGIYSSALSLIESILIISSSFATIILTQTANRNDEKLNVRLTFLLAKLSLILSAISVVALYFVPDIFFVLLLGKDFSEIKTVMLHLSPGILFISFSTVISHYFSGKGNQKLIAVANFTGLLITISISYFLINRYQIIGACYVANLSYLVSSLILVISYCIQNKLSFSHFFKFRSEMFLLKKN